jgi:hypothetical protein
MAGNNKLEERIEFIVEQQAQFSISIQRLEEAQANADKRMTRLEGIMALRGFARKVAFLSPRLADD